MTHDPAEPPATALDLDARKVIARSFGMGWTDEASTACDKLYPKCCQYHQGFDDALAEFCDTRSLVQVGWHCVTDQGRKTYGVHSCCDKAVPMYIIQVEETP